MSQSETLWSEYEDLGLIGKGACSKVRGARHRLTGVKVAIKILEKAMEKVLRISGEVDILKTITHPNIVTLFQVIETHTRTYLVLELCQNELLWHVHRSDHLQEDEARNIFCQVLDAVCYCHSQGIAHGDIKANNIMVEDSGKVTLIDFGMATRFIPGQKTSRPRGAIAYMSPEVLQHRPYDVCKKDVWSLGVLLYFMVIGSHAFQYRTISELKKKIIKGDYTIPEFLSEELRDLIRLLLTRDPKLRPTAVDILKHPWIQRGKGGHHEPLPKQLDPDIVSLMALMWFGTSNIVESIQERKYNKVMATYRLLQYQAQRRMGENIPDKPVCPGTTPFPTLTDSAAIPLPPKRKQCVPVFQTSTSCSEAQEQPEDAQQTELVAFSNVTWPNIQLAYWKKMATVTPSAKCLHLLTAPDTLCPGPGPQLPEKTSLQMKEEQPGSSTQGSGGPGSSPKFLEQIIRAEVTKKKPAAHSRGTQDRGNRLKLLEKTPALEILFEKEPETSNRDLRRRWKALRRRVQNFLSRVCVRLRPSQSRLNCLRFRSKVSPVKAEDSFEEHEGPRNL